MPDDVVVADAELGTLLQTFERRGRNLGQITPVIAEMLVTAVHDVFEAEGPGWPRHAASTLRKRRGRTGHKLLQDTGHLITSVHGEQGPDFARATTNVPYAVYHTSSAPRTILPDRNPFLIPDSVADDVVDLMLSHLVAE
jgi:phage gpG-like protein